MGDEMICGFPGCSEYMYSDWTGETSYYEEDSGGWWSNLSSSLSLTSIIGGLGSSIFDYFGSKDDVELAEAQADIIEAQIKAQADAQRQKTRNYIIIGGVIFFILTIVAFIIIAKKKK
jgi:hypothetical protein